MNGIQSFSLYFGNSDYKKVSNAKLCVNEIEETFRIVNGEKFKTLRLYGKDLCYPNRDSYTKEDGTKIDSIEYAPESNNDTQFISVSPFKDTPYSHIMNGAKCSKITNPDGSYSYEIELNNGFFFKIYRKTNHSDAKVILMKTCNKVDSLDTNVNGDGHKYLKVVDILEDNRQFEAQA